MYEIFPSSDAMKNEGKKYPWHTVLLGNSFRVPASECKFKTLQNYASRMGKKLNKVFRVKDHGPEVGYEVGLIGYRNEN